MQHLLALARRRFAADWHSRVAALVIAAAVIAAWSLYFGYMQYMGAAMAGRVADSAFPADFALKLPPRTDYAMQNDYAETLQQYQVLEAETELGLQPVAAIIFSGQNAPLPNPSPGEVWLPDSLLGLGELPVGSQFTLSHLHDLRYQTVTGTVAGYYAAYDYYPAILVNRSWLDQQGVTLDLESVSLYRQGKNFQRWPLHLPVGGELITARTTADRAKEIVAVAFSSGGEGVFLLFLFLTLGVGTFSLLSFMDSRRQLALLKCMGLRPWEVRGLFVIENAFTLLLGLATGLCVVLVLDRGTLLPITITWPLCARTALLSLLAFAAATAIPLTLAEQASVNELLLGRPIPLVRRAVTGMKRRYPTLEPLLAAGLQAVKLPAEDTGFPGICFRQCGQQVKQGETLAWQSSLWGIWETEYLAPCDGEVVLADLTSGLLLLQPD